MQVSSLFILLLLTSTFKFERVPQRAKLQQVVTHHQAGRKVLNGEEYKAKINLILKDEK